MHVQDAINIDAPVDVVFDYLTHWERWPEWMSHVRSVTVSGPRGAVGERSHWEVSGPGGATMAWNAEVTDFQQNKLVAWKTVEGEGMRHSGALRFDASDNGSVRVEVEMTYDPPGGLAGEAVAKLLSRDARRDMEADLARLKSAIEASAR